ncbi:MAG: ASCH domain-containing protein, partial [Chloroflexi bacterium]|nr:ASCH domain-containing protein [Chloroflexota bacterium]
FENPMGVIETIDVEIVPFDEVTRNFAQSGGEWGGTLEQWRKSYWSWIKQECEALGREPVTDIPMICERFKVVYSEPLTGG